ncbi:hypothetical protein FNF27_04707 [Cafeteria roenbergensis]|uniref:PH domain-containing protein n=2 Tax=Cafeteria roenbergensis TaxID=33653 RepID=A0A5A8E8A7_CAFRO|nr:hypothetical protein FNF27_04707 [Cafeteria roenbergensis]
MEGAGAVEDNDDAFVRAALHALDDQQQTLLDVARLLPAMRVLVDEKASAQQRSTAAAGAKAWLDEYESKQRIRGTAVEPDKAGYLRKVAQSGLATATRWVVLEGHNLSYFVDRAETDLRGVLRLPGTVCERCRGMGSRRNSFRLSAAPGTAAAGSDAGALNPLNSGKRAYVFAADSSEEADEWVALIRRAASSSAARAGPAFGSDCGGPDASGLGSDLEQGQRDRCLAWSAALGGAPDSTQYRRRLRGLCREAGQSPALGGGRAVCRSWTTIRVGDLPLRPVLTVGGAWARVHLRAVWERDMALRGRVGVGAAGGASDSDGLVSTGRAPALGSPLFARRAHASAASSGGFSSAYLAGAMLSAAKPDADAASAAARARRAEDLARRGSVAIPRIEPAVSARMPVPPRLRVPAGAGGAAEAAVAAAESAVTDAAAAAARRLWGFSPGDRADLHQLAIDVGRDCTVVDGTVMAASRLEHVVRALAAAVRQAGSTTPADQPPPRGPDLAAGGQDCDIACGGAGAGEAARSAPLISGDEEPDEEGEVDGAAGAEDQDSAGSDGGDDLDGDSAGESEAATVASRLRGTARADAKLTSFVANVLACSCRTAAGGDAYEALELALRCPSTAVIVPQGGIAAPVVLTVASSLARYTAPPVRVMPLGAVPSHAAAGAAAGGRAAELVIPTPPLSEAERETAKRARAPPPPPGHEARLRSNGVQNPGGRPVFVVADTTLFYRVRALDGRGDVVPDKEDDDAEAVAPLPEGFGFPAGACECASSPTAKADSALLAASGVASFSDDESDAGPSEADDTRGEGAAEPGREAGALGTGRPRGQALEELEWQRGDIAFVAAHFRRVFPFGSRPGKGTVRVFATCRPGGTGAIGGDGSAGGGGDE